MQVRAHRGGRYLVDPASDICFVRRLTHASLSIISIDLRDCEWLIKPVMIYLIVTLYMDNRMKIELIHERSCDCGVTLVEAAKLLDRKPNE